MHFLCKHLRETLHQIDSSCIPHMIWDTSETLQVETIHCVLYYQSIT